MLSLPLIEKLISLPMDTIKDVCKLGMGEKQCRYLSRKNDGSTQYYCLRTQPHLALIIDGEVEATKKRWKDTGKPNTFVPLGKNCPGFQVLEPS